VVVEGFFQGLAAAFIPGDEGDMVKIFPETFPDIANFVINGRGHGHFGAIPRFVVLPADK